MRKTVPLCVSIFQLLAPLDTPPSHIPFQVTYGYICLLLLTVNAHLFLEQTRGLSS